MSDYRRSAHREVTAQAPRSDRDYVRRASDSVLERLKDPVRQSAKEFARGLGSVAGSERQPIDVVKNQHGIGDAIRHAMASAELASWLGDSMADLFGQALELGSNDPLATEMDLHNNEVGRQVGQASRSKTERMFGLWDKIVSGELKVKDRQNGGLRDSNVRDIGGHDWRDASGLEDKFKPDRPDRGDPDIGPGRDDGPIVA
jgi:Domain of unknown function (DUF6973)